MATPPTPPAPSLPEALMDVLLERVLMKAGSERLAELDLLVIAHPEHAEAMRRVVTDSEATERLLAGGFADPSDGKPRAFGDYEIERELGRGGMGIVYAALQRTLGRRVALKVLSVPMLAQPRVLERFQRESSLLARLEHNGIVRVIDAGIADGLPFYTMEYVDGAPLAAVIQAVRLCGLARATGQTIDAAVADAMAPDGGHAAPSRIHGSTAMAAGTYVHRVAEIAAQVAEALAFAHAAGVIHRDVKPSNVLVRRDGTAVLSDFGIARLERAPSLTLTGDFAGTPYYVSPEQARGARVDHRTDVFSLGVTLYELLTLHRPFEGTDTAAVLVKIQRDEPADPRQHNAAVTAELAAIVLEALAKDPAQRYAGAGELAADLRAFLTGRPVMARPPTRTQRLWRWCRREPWQAATLATAAIAAGVLAVLSIGITRRLLDENASTKAALVLAEHNFDKATQAVEAMLTRVGERDLADVPQMELVRRDLLQRALAFYADFAAARAGDRRSQLHLAMARGRMARIRRLLNEDQAAIDAALAAIVEFDALLDASPGDAQVLLERAAVQLTLASARGALGDVDGARQVLAAVLATVEPLTVPAQLELDRRRNLAFALYAAANLERFRDPAAARATLERATAELAAVRREAPDDTAVLTSLVNARITLGRLAHVAGDSKRAEALLRQAEEDLKQARPIPELMRQRALIHEARAMFYKDIGRLDQAVEEATACVKVWQELVASFPQTPILRSRLGQAWTSLGNCQRYLGNLDRAVAATREAVGVYDRLTASLPDVLEFREGLARAQLNLGSMLARSESQTWQEEGATVLGRAAELAERLHADNPAQAEYARLAADCLGETAHVTGAAGEHAPAQKLYERAADLWGKAIARHPDNAYYQDGQANMLRGVAEELLALDDAAGALAIADRSLGLLHKTMEREQRNPARRRFMRNSLHIRAEACAKLGDHASAQACLAELTPLADGHEDALDAAGLAARCLDGTQGNDRETYAAACLAALSLAVDRGYRDAAALARDRRFRALRQHPGFLALRQRLAQ